jgi:DNA polymerase elongation subunit (family B)
MSYNFELIQIDPQTCSIEELDKEIARLKSLKEEYFNLEQSIKIFINSIYGGVGSPWFEGYNVALAEAVTLQGQDMIKYANNFLDDYFLNKWHLDTKLHAALGLTRVNKIQAKTVVIYNDTDSTYVTLGPVVESCDWAGDPKELILQIEKLRLSKYIEQKFDEYAKKFNTENLQNLELEKISYSSLMVAKKKYILDIAWKDPGISFKPQEKVTPVGVEIVQGSTPPFSRKVLKELLSYFFSKGKELEYSDIVKKLKEYKKQFILQEPNEISKTVSIGDYEKYVLEDRKEIKLAEKCPINVRASSIYNHTLMNTKWKTKYNLIRTGDKIKHYYAKGNDGVFGFLPGDYPFEFAPEVDYDMQFEKVIVEPFNRFMTSAGFNPVPGNLIYSKALF